MSVDKAQLCGSLLTWLQTFRVPSPCRTYQDLTSGVPIAQVLHRIDSSWFNEAWLLRIKDDPGGNWRLKVSNLKKIVQSVLEYSQDVLGHQISECHLPDVSLIGEFSDTAELGKLLQLVLGCAISCEKKQEHIQQIMTLEESVQHLVMEAIQELMTKDPSDTPASETYGNFDNQSRKYYFLSEDLEEPDDTRQRCQDLEQQISGLMEEKNSLTLENKALRSRLESDTGGKKLLLLQTQLAQLQEETFRLESGREDLRTRCEELEREVQELQHRNEELSSLAEEAQALKDEMDVLRHSSDKVSKLEAAVDAYKKKLQDLGDLRRQVRLLEERNTVYMQRTCELEEELRKANAVRAQLETHRRQVRELHSRHSEEALKAEKWQFEYRNLKEKFEALGKEKERLIEERDSLREANEELRCVQVQQTCLSQAEQPCPAPWQPRWLENVRRPRSSTSCSSGDGRCFGAGVWEPHPWRDRPCWMEPLLPLTTWRRRSCRLNSRGDLPAAAGRAAGAAGGVEPRQEPAGDPAEAAPAADLRAEGPGGGAPEGPAGAGDQGGGFLPAEEEAGRAPGEAAPGALGAAEEEGVH
ncbi:protein Hook homolog 2 isoform X2 [Carettochelys insculpta]|uniref:protein Hook homolog 2 isoform X2 n=1 Tax=Carettochelys insculpta TaxID=44489 RepID=UPI003EBB660F